MRLRRSLAVIAVTALLAVPTAQASAAMRPTSDAAGQQSDADADGFRSESSRLTEGLAAALRDAGFDDLVDFNDVVYGEAQPAYALPNVDVAVIELGGKGKVRGAANVVYDRDSPNGFEVRINERTLSTRGVQFSAWNGEQWDSQQAWDAGASSNEILVSPEVAAKEYMLTYPASVLKLMVGYSILRLVDKGKLRLGETVTFHRSDGKSCYYGPSNPTGQEPPPRANGAQDTLRGWMDQMITVSDNFATCVLLQKVYDEGNLRAANRHFMSIGLNTLRMLPSEPAVGSGWSSGRMTMGALDTSRLLLIVNGSPGQLWRANGKAVTADGQLSPRSQDFFKRVLGQQSFNEVLNPVNLCGSSDAVQGIPSTVPQRWVDPATGNVVTYDGDLVLDFGYDTRPCDEAAEVRFMHKTGLVTFGGADAGIVQALPGQDGRQYIVSVFSNAGYRFGDPDWSTSDPNACEGSPYVCYPRAFGRLGASVDELVKARPIR
ncbi:MAG: serine hydrolase [Actinomycetes bacterium]